ncbi:MAG: hypothetical protein II786_00140, partial [Muribaculaceae bacterium]|nr:hypothetical protein [Muribaculaceae bacterium]
MKKFVLFLFVLMTLVSCQKQQKEQKEQKEPGYIVQVALGHWKPTQYTPEQIIGRLDTVTQLIPVEK